VRSLAVDQRRQPGERLQAPDHPDRVAVHHER
jgi:hypothetical protein